MTVLFLLNKNLRNICWVGLPFVWKYALLENYEFENFIKSVKLCNVYLLIKNSNLDTNDPFKLKSYSRIDVKKDKKLGSKSILFGIIILTNFDLSELGNSIKHRYSNFSKITFQVICRFFFFILWLLQNKLLNDTSKWRRSAAQLIKRFSSNQ